MMICMINLYWNCSWRQNSKSQPQHNILNRANKRVICLSRFQTESLATPGKEIPLHTNSLSQWLPSQRRTEEKKKKEENDKCITPPRKFQAQILTVVSVLLVFML